MLGYSASSASVFRIQRRAVRIIAGLGYREDCKKSFVKLKILTLPSIYIHECIMSARNNLHLYQTNSMQHSYATRQQNNIILPVTRLKKTRTGTSYYGIKLYNALPLDIRSSDSKTLSKWLKTFLLSQAFFTIDEFFCHKFDNCIV
ncbi:hypothetical protein PPYR_04340 [Photinus pyralis]|uniref:Uncharacterized protein n=1 Tax=Photinus pyralis TaxID=7054 RepID=A0A5N4ACN4_PHOPY|nr:hypothetical protein PPYR_11910 [Photinus pyralis]KAB0802154.1 hypothetical protein PPYR_04340 [Photinus pyralis]